MEKLEKIFLEKGNVYKPSRSIEVEILENKKITEEGSLDDVRHLLLDMSNTGMKFYEGQSIGVIPPGVAQNGNPHKVRLYSISSCKDGEDGKGLVLALCVKRETTIEKEKHYKGICSHYLCDIKKGNKIRITGPVGRTFLLPKDNSVNLMFFATGTGIAPYRGFLQQIEKLKEKWKGNISLFMGCKTIKEALYLNKVNNELRKHSFVKNYLALSREEKNILGGRMYIQNRLSEVIDRIWQEIVGGNFSLYICGLKNMEKGLEQVFSEKAEKEGSDWLQMKKDFRKMGRWNVEVY